MLVRNQVYNIDTMPLLSVVCIVYNQENYLRETIESFLNQDVNFFVEILIHDDASTDNTPNIIKEYEVKYPYIIKPVFEEINQYSINGFSFSFDELKRANGIYIALCEGDDYWIDSYKLQKQINYLEQNKDCSLCFHSSKNLIDNKYFSIQRPKIITSDNKFSMKHAILFDGSFMATNSMVFVNECIKNIPTWIIKAPIGDWPLTLLLASKGQIGYIDDIMSVYRVMSIGSWSSKMKNRSKLINHYKSLLKMLSEFDNWSNYRFYKYVLVKKIYYFTILLLNIFIRNFELLINRIKIISNC
jgi:glycosyltransferase involved in cell wall biosynthesis